MKLPGAAYLLILLCGAVILTGCIHDHPEGLGNDPSKVNANIELTFQLKWDRMISNFGNGNTRARAERPHRLIVETMRNGDLVCRDTSYLSSADFEGGIVRHKLSKPLNAQSYQLAVWYDMTDVAHTGSIFNVDDLSMVNVTSTSVNKTDSLQCAYASEIIDLSEYRGKLGVTAIQEVEMKHPGARFELIATDIQDFISNQRAALLQGDSFILTLNFEEDNTSAFNIYSDKAIKDKVMEDRSGPLYLPFGNYEELMISEGFLFCKPDDEITMTVTVYNSARMIVTKTNPFSFPVKQGYITRVSGDFLTHPLDGMVTIDHIWEGEMVIEI